MRYANELKVGVAIVFSFILMIVGVRFFQNLPLFQGSYDLWAEFQDVGGLMEGNAVRIKGYQVGTVGRITLDPQTLHVRVLLHMNEDVKVPRGSRARIGGLSALSNVFVEIVPGPPENPPLEDGETIPADLNPDPVELLLEKSGPLLSRTDSLLLHLTGASASLRALLAEPGSDLRVTLSGLRHSVEQVDGLLQSERKRMQAILRNLEAGTSAMRTFAETQDDSLALMVQEARQMLQRLNGTLEEVRALSRSLGTITERLEQGEGTLGRMLQDPSLYEHLDSLAMNTNRLVEELRQNPGKYLKELKLFSLF